MSEQASPTIEKYFESIEKTVDQEYKIAGAARLLGHDPEKRVDSPLARNMVERVEGLISAVAPQLIGSGVTERMFELEKQYGVLDWRVSLVIAHEVGEQKFCEFKTKKEAMEVGIRTGFAYHTLGIVAAPLEGFIGLDIKKTNDGKEYFSVRFAGPIRGAGGTGASLCVLIADYVRKKMGYAPYDPDEKEIKRFHTELTDYHDRVTNLQYFPSEEECNFLAKHVPVQVDGDPTEKLDVSNFKDLPRVETNKIRGGLCLTFSMIALKAPKLWKRLDKWNDEMGLDWKFMGEFVKLQKKKKAGSQKKSEGEKPKISPNKTFIVDLVAGRPVLTHPLAYGGFRLRYGRARTTGYSASALHPATMVLLDDFIAVGTQLKLERPGKAASMTSCDGIEGPTVLLESGEVKKIHSVIEAHEIKKQVSQILFLGDILFNLGDFSENGHTLVPAGYCEEWWRLDVLKALAGKESTSVSKESFKELMDKTIIGYIPKIEDCINLAKETNTPMHPYFTPSWIGLTIDEIKDLQIQIHAAVKHEDNGVLTKLVLDNSQVTKRYLERLAVPHYVDQGKLVITNFSIALAEQLKNPITKDDPLEAINESSTIKINDKIGTFIGARMGRPEKAKMRKLKGSPHSLFPVGEEGGRLKCFQSALKLGKVKTAFAYYRCKSCEHETVFSVCEKCNSETEHMQFDPRRDDQDPVRYKYDEIDINHYFNHCLGMMKTQVYPDLIKGVQRTSNKNHIAEHLLKGILRAKHEVYVNKDGSVRFDMTELPITHFKSKEIGTPVEKLRELGYERDMYGNELVDQDQVLELRPQDLILPGFQSHQDEPANQVLYRVGLFIDDLLKYLYKAKPYYKYKSPQDVVGTLVLGLAPHISAGMVGRIIGFAKTTGCFAHPLWHAALRRDCDGDEASVSLLLDSLLNFSRQYLPDRIGSRTMDAPLVLTARLNPSEVDDMVHGLDVLFDYPLEFYEGAMEFKQPWEVGVDQLGKFVNTPKQYEDIGFTVHTSDINNGVLCSAYKILPSMREKLEGQMGIAEKVSAVDTSDVARLVIEKHFIKDIKGNLRKFSMQQFRCVGCNTKFRRPPLIGKCTECGGKIIFTISQGSVIKYMGPALQLAKKYDLNQYLIETLENTQQRIDEVFGKEMERQEGLDKWS